MKQENEIQVVGREHTKGMRIQRKDTSIEFSPEFSQHICSELINLGAKFISETGRVSVELFKTQADMYYGQLNAYISGQTLKSDERKIVLKQLEKLIDKYLDLMNKTDDLEKMKLIKSTYESVINAHSKLYLDALDKDASTQIPETPNLLKRFRNLFSKKR
jgi:hypothetical protein